MGSAIKLTNGLEIDGLSLKARDSLILADLHIGLEESYTAQGVLMPGRTKEDQLKRMISIIGDRKYGKIIINGDFKHEHGRISSTEWRHAVGLIKLFKEHAREVILIKGNHDNMIVPIASGHDVLVRKTFTLKKSILILHGHELTDIPNNIRTIVIGHEHPAISIKDKTKTETYKCFLRGTYKKKELIVQPSYSELNYGTDIRNSSFLSPFLKTADLSTFEVFVVEDKVYPFGKLKDIP